jgi:hypothetical protein
VAPLGKLIVDGFEGEAWGHWASCNHVPILQPLFAWNLTEQKVDIPTSLIGRMDLINEFTRRGRDAAGLPEIPPRGNPLAAGPDQPLPPLVKLDINERTRKHITQEVADRVLQFNRMALGLPSRGPAISQRGLGKTAAALNRAATEAA